jgi:hypothetical protein
MGKIKVLVWRKVWPKEPLMERPAERWLDYQSFQPLF